MALTTALHKYLYVKMGKIGEGAYGSVFRAYHRETHELLAIKAAAMTEYGLSASTLREITTLKELRHPNIVGLRDVIMSPAGPPPPRQGAPASMPGRKQSCYLVVELLHCDLHAFMQHRPHALSMGMAKSIMYQLLSGLKHAHAHGIMHRDIKPMNILMGPAPPDVTSAAAASAMAPGDVASAAAGRVQIKIADFGLARPYLPDEQPYTDWVVTLFYRPPELLLGCKSYTPTVDVWSAGCILAEMANAGSPLFVSDSELGQLDAIFAKLGTPSAKAWPELEQMLGAAGSGARAHPQQPLKKLVPRLAADPQALDLLGRMLAPNPRHRLSAARALAHPWFDDIRAAETAALQAAMAAEAARLARCGAAAKTAAPPPCTC
ncbi:hypothetical protein HXX76_013632 [Chlamydomonas incerta]|uniref:cyclin-dependent kinase n=1 Tax=Chlamydomonas incerta TaxID=51695 RepID=A0A835SEP1_CHLIN|nr:hypothetical protein HXX76_013632 [Chlamydomonas incerta]|eukprot:KAG2425589.1 hypothetical protein HXX76_013632 [Chlamydomonas incerta]